MKFEVRQTAYNEYDVRLGDKTATRIRRFLWFLYYAACGVIVYIVFGRKNHNNSPE